MKVLILGSGGREHALAWRLSQDETCKKVMVWPGNEGMIEEKISLINLNFSKESFVELVKNESIDLVIPGAEKFLYEGISDWCDEVAVSCFGPDSRASMLEKSKIFSKTLMTEAGIPTSVFSDITEKFNRDLSEAMTLVRNFKRPVIKISGPSLAKGVYVCQSHEEAYDVLLKLKENPEQGLEDGLLVEEGVEGKEISMFFACSGTRYSYLGSAQDHKRVFDGDKGPNTGGMGAISPVPWANDNFVTLITEKFLTPTLHHMEERGIPFRGVLFLGLMVNQNEINLLEYNVRFGDPETQVLLPLIKGDLTQFLYNFTNGQLTQIERNDKTAVHVVKAAKGYPGTFGTSVDKGRAIHLSGSYSVHGKLFFAGVKREGKDLVTHGGRVLGVTSWARDPEEARLRCYEMLGDAHFEGEHFRRDIGKNL